MMLLNLLGSQGFKGDVGTNKGLSIGIGVPGKDSV